MNPLAPTQFVKTVQHLDFFGPVNMDSIFTMIEGKLVITQKVLEKFECKETFWEKIAVLQPEELVVTRENDLPISYNRNVLKQLIDLKPELKELIEEYILNFGTGESLVETKARLVLCGEFFKIILYEWNTQKIIDLPSRISLNGFSAVLSIIEKGKLDSKNNVEEFLCASGFMQFTESIPIEGVYGREDLEKYFGAIGEVAPFPTEAFEPSPINPNKRWIDDFEFFWMPPEVNGVKFDVGSMERIAASEKFGARKIRYEYCYSKVRLDAKANEPIKKGYWYAIGKATSEELKNTDYENIKNYLQQNFLSLTLPTIREALLYYLMHHINNGSCILGQDPGAYALCSELVIGADSVTEFNVIVGGVSPSGLRVDYTNRAHKNYCVLLSHKFC